MPISEERKIYMHKYRIENRDKIYKYRNEYIKRTGKKYYKPKGEKIEGLYGTSGLGRKYEKIALSLLSGSIDANENNFRGKYDVEWNGHKIDVKMRNFKNGKWHFTTKKNPGADYYLLFCVKNELIKKILLLPKGLFKSAIDVRDPDKKLDTFKMLF